MKRSAQESDMSTDRFPAGKSADRLVDNRLENGCSKVFSGSTIVDQRLDICLCKYTTACSNRIKSLIIFSIFIQTGCIGLEERCHLVDKGTCTTGTDTIHTLLDISAFKIDDLGILAAKLDRNISLWSVILQSCRYSNDLLHKRYAKMFGKCQSATSCDNRRNLNRSEFVNGTSEKI